MPATAGGERTQGGDKRAAAGKVAYWEWGGQHLVRYLSWEAGSAWDGSTPAMLLCHGTTCHR